MLLKNGRDWIRRWQKCKDLDSSSKKLSNEKFVSRAEAVVQKERDKSYYEQEIEALQNHTRNGALGRYLSLRKAAYYCSECI